MGVGRCKGTRAEPPTRRGLHLAPGGRTASRVGLVLRLRGRAITLQPTGSRLGDWGCAGLRRWVGRLLPGGTLGWIAGGLPAGAVKRSGAVVSAQALNSAHA